MTLGSTVRSKELRAKALDFVAGSAVNLWTNIMFMH